MNSLTHFFIRNQHITGWTLIIILYFKISNCCLESTVSKRPKKSMKIEDLDPKILYFSESQFRFQNSIYNVSIPENCIGKTYVSPSPYEDRLGITATTNVDVNYKIISGDPDKLFKAEERTIGNFAFLTIRTRTNNVVLNREKTDEYYLRIKAVIRSQHVKNYTSEAETVVHVRVLDRNDLSPLFYPTEYETTVSEDIPIHKSIITLTAEDADLGINGEIYYSFLDDNDYFAIHPSSGVISLIRQLKYSHKSIFELTAFATDRASAINRRDSQGSKAKVVIRVKQVNYYPPEIHVNALYGTGENSKTHLYGIVKVIDKDSGCHGEIRKVEIVGGDPDGHFSIKESTFSREYFLEINRLALAHIHRNGYNLTLRAEDKGTPALSSYKVVPIHIFSNNNSAPIFTKQLYEVSVSEASSVNTPVIRLRATDPNFEKNALVVLEIVGGNEGGEFRINPDSGMLYTQKLLDTEYKSFYSLTVSAIDQANVGIRKQSSAKVKINIVDVNDNDPIFDVTNKTVTIDENAPAGTVVLKLTAKDKDSGENSYISYSIANLNEVPFEVDHFTGVLRTTVTIDYETMRREYLLSVRASDWGLPYRRQTEIELLIKIRDINDNRPQFERINCVGKVLRNIPIGTDIFTLSAIDFDGGDFITYRLTSGNGDGCFNLDPLSGVLSVACDLRNTAISNRIINFSSTDSMHFSDEMSIQIDLLDMADSQNNSLNSIIDLAKDYGSFECRETGVARRHAEILALAEKNNAELSSKKLVNFALMPSRYGENLHAPEFVDFPRELIVNESVQLGETVVWIRGKDRDLGYNGKLTFTISDGDADSVFRIDPDTGELQIIGYLDRERQDQYILNITVYDMGQPQKFRSKLLPVNIVDVNDNPPVFQKALACFHLTENAINGTVIFHLRATDADLGQNGYVTYAMITDTSDFFLDPITGVLYVIKSLDRETISEYELHIIAKDGGIPSLVSEAIVRIYVEDINDNAPQFSMTQFVFKIREDIPRRTVVSSMQATDMDLGINAEILYSLEEDILNEALFTIDTQTGVIRTKDFLDYESRQVHNLLVIATDRGTPSLTSNVTVVIEILDVNENQFAPEFSDFVFVGSVMENKPRDTFVMNVTAVDADADGVDSKISYSIRGGDGMGLFAVNHIGAIRTLVELDAEVKDYYWLTLCAQDQSVISLWSCVQIFISVNNVNDNVPLTDKPVYYPSVMEGSPSGVAIFQLMAKDEDKDASNKITYKIISGNPEGYFALDAVKGILSTTERKLDRENQSEHILEVSVSDNGYPVLSSTTRIVVNIDDINDHSPEFDQSFYKILVPSTLSVNSSLFQVLAFDNDVGENGRITYSIKSGKGKSKCRIDSRSGIVYVTKKFNTGNKFELNIKAEDNGSPKRSQIARLNVIIIPIANSSEHAPVIRTLDLRVDVTESDRPGFLVALIQASDADDDHLWYNIEGDDRNEFYIGRDNGNILLSKSLDSEVQKNYNLTVTVSDGVNVASTQLYVNVIDINDNRPQFSKDVYQVNISESIEEESTILQLHATDLDEDKKIFYTLHAARSPSSLSLFRIDSITGNVITVDRLDREKASEHILIVTAKDQGTPANRNYAKVIINVCDHNDHYPEFSLKIVQSEVLENAEIGSKVVQMFALDQDYGRNAEIKYSIVSGNIGNSFEIDSTMGLVTVAKSLSNNIREYMLQIKASDLGSPALSSQIPLHVIVTASEYDPPKFSSSHILVEIFENVTRGTYVANIDAHSSSSIFYEILDDAKDEFQINPSAGVIVTKENLDYETQRSYNLTIRATNMASASSNTNVLIHVLDVNDNAPSFVENKYFGEISEAAEIGSLVLTSNGRNRPMLLITSDSDSGVNGITEFTILDDVAQQYFLIDSSTGAVKTKSSLDYEKITEFKFNVIVSDLGSPKLFGRIPAEVVIQIINTNDSPPTFKDTNQNITLYLPTYANIFVTQVNAVDADKEESVEIRYDIIEGNSARTFAIDSKTGVISTRNVETLESAYILHVRASDGLFSSVTQIYISVEHSESSDLVFQKSIYEFTAMENSTNIFTIGLVNVLGTHLNEQVEYHILNPTNMFKIGITSGVIKTTGQIFDRELQDNYKLILEAKSSVYRDTSKHVRRAHAIANIQIADVNDNCPLFVNLPYYAIVSIDDLKGSVIIKVQAIDLDTFENGDVRYEMKKGNGELFKVDRKTGELSLRQSLEGHNRDYELVIAAYDGAISPCSTEVLVHVKVVDKSVPVFSKQFYSYIVNENIEIYSTLLISIQAESPLRRKLIYNIAEGNDNETFDIDFITGSICVVNKLDYEKVNNYELVVRATDSVSGISADVPVSIQIEDANDCYPKIEKDTYKVTITENAILGTQVLRITAQDNDTLVNGDLSYFIEHHNGNNSDFFHIDITEGIIYLKQTLDYEAIKLHHLVVVVVDHGTPSLSSRANVWITVVDVNDNPPRFIDPSFTSKLSMQAVRGQFVTIIKASDLDKSDATSLVYKIVNGNEMQKFAIDGASGVITVHNIQNLYKTKVSLLNVSVTDGVFTSYARVKITLLPENIHAPIFSQLVYEVIIKENSMPGSSTLNVTAKDADFGDYSKITYDISTADMREYFAVGKHNGVIETKTAFDREKRSEYEFLVKATDGGGKYGFATVKVKIDDVNDNAPMFMVKEYRTTANIDIKINSVVLKVQAVDADEHQNKIVKYYIYNSTSDPELMKTVKINEANGEIVIMKSALELNNKLLQFFVRAYDNGNVQLYSEVPVSIRFVSPETEIPTLENKNRNLYVSESLPPGTVLTKLRYSGNFTLRYSISTESPHFSLSDNAELLLMEPLDRELTEIHVIFIIVETITTPTLYLINQLNIHIQDENDNKPVFTSNSYSVTVAENVNKMSSIVKISAKDTDSGSNGDIRYYFADDAHDISNVFDIDIYSGWITTLKSLDRENQSVYKFHVIASDNGQQKHVTRAPVEIKLQDYNDNPPYFKEQLYEVAIDENAVPGTVLLHLSLLDLDEKKNDVDFFIIDGDIYSQFHIGQSGEIFISNALDREEIAFYNLSLLATDGKFIAKASLYITIRDVNDNVPYCIIPKYEIAINESLAIGTTITEIVAIDADEKGTEILRYYLTGAGSDDFSVDKGMRALKVAKNIDREIQAKYVIQAHVQDGLHLQWECISDVVIIVNDLNDNEPEFSMKQYIVSIPEDAQVGTLVTKIHASDRDIGMNRKIEYFIEEQDHFNISKHNGIVTLAKPLDRETVSTFNISVRAEDCGIPKLFMTAFLIINVLDINDNPPEFILKHYVATISEESPFQTEVITVSATSKDTGVNAEVSYFIVGGNEQKRFAIDLNSGTVFVNGILDYEKTKGYLLTIQAVDGGTPPLSNIATLNISIEDVNDNAPKFLQNSYRVKVSEDINTTAKILQVIAVDEDSGQNSVITYNIASGDRLNQFSVDEHSGYIFTVSLLDRESILNYLLEIQACDGGVPQLCSYVNVYVDIIDANDNPPLFAQNNFKVVVQENRDLGYVLLKLNITDADDYPNSSPYTFDLRSGNERNFFRLEQDGTLRTAGRFNQKIRDSYELQIRVFDNGTPPLFSDAWVHIKVIKESQYPPIITPLEITVHSYEDEFAGGFLGRVYATDQDQYDALHYGLSTVLGEKFSPNNLFNISHDNGDIYAISNLDVGVYRINATVTDGKFLTSGIVRINVELINAEMIQHAVVVKFRNTTPEHFILSHRKGFIRSIRTVMRCRQKDVIIISIQPSNNDVDDVSHLRNARSLGKAISSSEKAENTLDILFTVRKQQVNPVLKGFFAKDEIRSTVIDNMDEIEETTSLMIKEVVPIVCSMVDCINGKCKYKIILSKTVTTTHTDVVSFVLPNYNRIKECECKQGFDGKFCKEPVNACSSDPCLPDKICLPSRSFEGYQCVCPQGYYGHFCEHETRKCENSSCDISFSSISFGGKSYAHYRINQSSAKSVIENQFAMFLKVRTLQHTGTLMFASGKIDYNILEISNGAVQYKFDLGSGEGFVSVSSVYIADGKWHSISLERILNNAKLIVDHKHISQGSAPGMNGILNLQSHDIFIGAEVRPHPSIAGLDDIQKGFIGCLEDVRIWTEPLPLYISGESEITALKRFTNVEFTCNPSIIAEQDGVCGAQPCMNGGVCIDLGSGNFKCHCVAGRFTGKFCQFDLDPCTSAPCLFGAQCNSDSFGNYSCVCPVNLSGKRCEFGRFCEPNPCQNEGICDEGDGRPHCICRGYTGVVCEIDIDECENQPCGDEGTCINEAGSFRCICPSYLTGTSCGDPPHSNSITTRLKNISFEHITGIIFGVTVVLIFLTIGLSIILCRRKNDKSKSNKKKDRYKRDNLNSLLAKEDNKRNSKLINLEVNQRSISYTSTNENNLSTTATFLNNLDVMRSYGSAGDELENIPVEYQKINRTNQEININAYTHCDNQKQCWSDQMHLRTFSENKLNNEKSNNRTSSKANKFDSGKLIRVAMPNVCPMQHLVEILPNNHGQYHWDCSDWVRESQNPLPDITEVPSAEIADSSSFHSNESNESEARVRDLVRNIDAVDPMRDIKTLNEDIHSDKEPSCQPSSLSLDRSFSISRLSTTNQSKNEDYKTNTGAEYLSHPDSYLTSLHIPCETDLNINISINDINKTNDNGERKRTKSGSSEEMFLLYPENYNRGSSSDMSVQLCEIEDSEFDEFLPPRANSKPNLHF